MEETTIAYTFMSAQINEIATALSEFQGSIKQPKLSKEVKVATRTGSNYKFRYADLSACMEASREGLKANGLAVVQMIDNDRLITLLTHKSGQWFQSVVNIRNANNLAYQDLGSAITYLKRYSFCGILGIVADDDDDANRACGNQAVFSEPKQPQQQGRTIADIAKSLDPEKELDLINALDEVAKATTKDSLTDIYKRYKTLYDSTPLLKDCLSARRKELGI